MNITRIEDMTMDTFPVNAQNRSDYHVCREMLLHPELFRLVFFHLPASEGLHLKHAIMNDWKSRVDWRSVSAREFTDDLVSAIYKGTHPFDMAKYEEPDVLIVDDLQHLAGKEATQEDFYIILKRRLENRKLTILFSQCGIEDLRTAMRDELVHLLTMGVPDNS